MRISEHKKLVDCKTRFYRQYSHICWYCLKDVVRVAPKGVLLEKVRHLVERKCPVTFFVYRIPVAYEMRNILNPYDGICTACKLTETDVVLDEQNGTISVCGTIPDEMVEKILYINDLNVYNDVDYFKIDCIERNSETIKHYGQGNL